MNTITDELNVLKSILELLKQANSHEDFVGKADVESRLRWAAKNTADKIHMLSSLKG
jgi:hypothetical protein